ncbi:MAG: MarR family winged helix-turn-helix transcriptional regulator [Dehalococcoidia bacterium]
MPLQEYEEHQIARMLRHVSLLMTKARQNELAHLGVTPSQVGVLHHAQMFDTPCTIIQLRELMRRSNSSMVGIINRMERKGLIKRQVDSESKKYTRIILTEKGKNLYNQAVSLTAFAAIVSSLPKEDRQRLRSYLETLSTAAQNVLGKNETLKDESEIGAPFTT